MSSLEPFEEGYEREDAHEASGRLLVAGGDGTSFLEPGSEVLDMIAAVVDPVWASDEVGLQAVRPYPRCAHGRRN